MPQHHFNDPFEARVKAALGKEIGDGFQHTGPSQALRDKMLFEAGRAAQGRADRKYLAGSLFLGLASGLGVIVFLPPPRPIAPAETSFVKWESESKPTPAPESSSIWHARVDPKQIEDPPPDLGGTEFVHADHPMTVRSISELLKELQP